MSEEGKLEKALQRLDQALDSFETAAVRVSQSGRSQQSLQEELDFLREDRSRLADALDSAQSEARGMRERNEQISARLDGIMHNIRALLAGEHS